MRDAYDDHVAQSPQGSVFASSWWLDAVAGDAWEPNVVDDGQGVAAAWPTVARRSRWGAVHTGAPLTPFLGPLLPERGDGKSARSREIKLVESLVEAIGAAAHVEARCHPAFDYWTPLRWHGFQQTTHYTWQLQGAADQASTGFRDNIRGDIKKATKRGVEVGEASLDEFLAVHAKTVQRAGTGSTAESARAALRRVDPVASDRGARSILVARGGDGAVHAGAYLVSDQHTTYYLAGGSDQELRSSGATSLLLSVAIGQALGAGRRFDFEGSMLQPVERFFRAFGGTPVPYSIVRRTSSSGLRVERQAKRVARSIGRR